jgi:DNA-binding transcriptional regulator LsrR (DeoR family)
LLNSAGIQQVSRLYNLLNLALVGIGTLHNSPLVLAGLLEEPEIQRLAAAGAVGDICGHFYTLDGDPVDDAYPGASIGISWEQLRLCPQLLVVASGLEKAAPILGLLRTQMVNVLVTDEQTASRVVRDDRDSSGWALPSTPQM